MDIIESNGEMNILQHNINIMMTFDDVEEVSRMYRDVCQRLAIIYAENIGRINNTEKTKVTLDVIRCKNCNKWNNTNHVCGEFITNQKLQDGGKAVFITDPDDFCSYAVKKEQ